MIDRNNSMGSIWASGALAALKWQAACGLVVSVVIGLWLGLMPGLGVAFGVLFSLLNGAWLAKRIERAGSLDQAGGQRVLYLGAVARFLALIVALTLAHKLGFHLLAVAGGLLVAQLTMFGYSAAGSR
ncbi:MAG: ATP synthase subunit I [Mariprofundaceae bacterium]